ncbi:MAG: YunC family protein, partial [Lentisphaerota bacterium]
SIQLKNKTAEGCAIQTGPLRLVICKTDTGLIGCGLVDVMVYDRFQFPAAKVRAEGKPLIETVEDALNGIVREVNETAQKRGVKAGMTGREALELM